MLFFVMAKTALPTAHPLGDLRTRLTVDEKMDADTRLAHGEASSQGPATLRRFSESRNRPTIATYLGASQATHTPCLKVHQHRSG